MSTKAQSLDVDLAIALQWGLFQGRFLGQTAHELRALLSTIMGLQQLILQDLCEDPTEGKAFIAESYGACQKLLELLDLAITVSKLEHGPLSQSGQSFELNLLFQELDSLLSVKARNRNLHLHILYPEIEEQDIQGDRHHLFSFFLTLLDTTIQQTSEGKVNLSYALQGNLVTFSLISHQKKDFWAVKSQPISRLSEYPTLSEVQQLARTFDFSLNLKWQICMKLIESFGGSINRHHAEDDTILVSGQFPRSCS